MLAKRTSKNQITLPKAVVTHLAECDYFDVTTDGLFITLHPLQRSRADDVRTKLDELGIEGQDIADAVAWARESACSP